MVVAEERAAARPLRAVLPDSPTTELLSGLLLEGSETAYAAAARRRASGAAPAEAPRRTVLLLVVGLALTGAVLGVAAAQEREREPVDAAGRAALAAEADERLAAVDDLQAAVRDLRARVEDARRGALSAAGGESALAERVEDLELAAGAKRVTGPGVVVTVDDPERDAAGVGVEGDGAERVQDRDLQLVVNALWAAGAESVAVNGHRLTSLSAIRSAGAAILVDYVALTPPYSVSAIGDPQRLRDGFDSGDGGGLLRDLADAFGIRWSLDRKAALDHPAASALSLRYASVADGAPSAGSSGAPR
ncbi:DUF881 domain-containing protein [Motilibacter deserti]|uniref:DUF881 domain-containing protein n=1 Tax=Motilibacter deserti TaxID=2714956 RepID=A0ABX0GTQ7_9ACTN|nr:DUF881 domain-containing protein [Motilibacter deserti]NHC14276.1 DUF881 domain-containing protein [Motilibacter deserti]